MSVRPVSLVSCLRRSLWHRGRRGARPARREKGEAREYLTDEECHAAGCIGGRMQTNFGDTTRALILLGAIAAAGRTAAAQGQAPLTASQPTRSTPPAPLPLSTFLGGVPSGDVTGAVETISIVAAIARALEYNLGVLTAEHGLGRAQGARWRALSELLPNINGRVTESRQQINLQAFGFGGLGPGFANIPTIVGPFDVFDARVFLTQSILDFGALNGARAEAHNVEAARLTYRSAREFVINVAGNLYIQALAASARVDGARAAADRPGASCPGARSEARRPRRRHRRPARRGAAQYADAARHDRCQ